MSGLIGADNQFGKQFHAPNTKLQGLIVSIYDVCTNKLMFELEADVILDRLCGRLSHCLHYRRKIWTEEHDHCRRFYNDHWDNPLGNLE